MPKIISPKTLKLTHIGTVKAKKRCYLLNIEVDDQHFLFVIKGGRGEDIYLSVSEQALQQADQYKEAIKKGSIEF